MHRLVARVMVVIGAIAWAAAGDAGRLQSRPRPKASPLSLGLPVAPTPPSATAPAAPATGEDVTQRGWSNPGMPREVDNPWAAALAYREAIAAGMVWVHGLAARPLDPADHRIGSAWEVDVPGGKAIRFELAVVKFAADGARAVGVLRDGRREVLEFKKVGADAAARAADLAIDDLPAILGALGLSGKAAAAPHRPAALPPWTLEGVEGLAGALLPLDRPAGEVTPAELARAAYALAWTALVDQRLAPAGAPRRAAQALAFAAVAERLEKAALPEAQAVRWLAPGAAAGDWWLLARAEPPKGFADLVQVHEALKDADFPLPPPASWGAASVALTERVLALGRTALLAWFCDGKRAAPVAFAYQAFTDEFSAVRRTCMSASVGPLTAVLRMREGVETTKETMRLVKQVVEPPAPIANKKEFVEKVPALVVAAARALAEEAAACRSFRKRVVLEECADRALHGLCALATDIANLGWSGELEKGFAGHRKHADWMHPELQWQLADAAARPDTRDELAPIIGNAVAARAVIPGLAHRTAMDESPSRVGRTLAWSSQMALLARYPGSPRVMFDTMQMALAQQRAAEAYALLARLLETAPPPAAPLFGEALGRMPGALQRLVLDRAPKFSRTPPVVAHELASRLRQAGKDEDALKLLEEAIGEEADPILALDIVDTLADLNRLDVANLKMEMWVKMRFPGLSESQLTLALANHALRANDGETALKWARVSKESAASWAITGHAMIALATGHADEALKSIDEVTAHYGPNDEYNRIRMLHTAVSSGGKEGWSGLGYMLGKLEPANVDEYVRVLDAAKIALPKTPLGEKLAFARDAGKLVSSKRAPDPAAVMALVTRARGKGEAPDFCRARMAGAAVALVPRSLMRGGEKGEARKLDGNELKELLDVASPDRYVSAQYVLHVMHGAGAPPQRMREAIDAMAPLLGPREQVFLNFIGEGTRTADWLAVTGAAQPLDENIDRYLMYVWLADRKAECKTVLATTMATKPRPRPMFSVLAILGGSDTAATKWLTEHGVSEGELPSWGWSENIGERLAGFIRMMAPLRPAGAATNLLE